MIRVLEVNNLDLMGCRWNGYDMIQVLSDDTFDIKQAVIDKSSNNKKVIEILKNNTLREVHNKIQYYEEPNESIKSIISVSSPALMHTKEYKEADIIHLHLIHNTGLSLYSLLKMSQEKKVVISLHDAWLLTGRCAYPYDCEKWKNGCKKCGQLGTMFAFKEDRCSELWNTKKKILDNIDVDYIVPSDWLAHMLTESPIFQNKKNIHKIFFGIDLEKFQSVTYKEARKELKIKDNEIVIFHRAQNEFKGTPYVLEALKNMKPNDNLVVLTCDGVGLLDEVKDKFKIRDLGRLKENEMIVAMNACDIFLMPSTAENAGVMAIEAMSCSKPIIVFSGTGLPYVTHAPEVGYLVESRNSIALGKAIEHLVSNKKEREKRGRLGKEIVLEEYSNEKYYNSLRKLYKEVYDRKRKPIKKLKIDETENSEQFKFFLNDLTVRFFGTSSKISKKLRFKTKNIKRNKTIKYDYSDLSLLQLLDDYMDKMVTILENEDIDISNTTKMKIEKTLYLLKNNPDFLKNKLKNR